MKRLVLITILLLTTTTAWAQRKLEYDIDKSYGDVVAAVERLANEPRTTPFKLPDLPAILSGKFLKITTCLDPNNRTYTAWIELAMPAMGNLAHFEHRIRVTGHPNHYHVYAWVDIEWHMESGFGHRIVNCVAARKLPGIEDKFLCLEKAKLLEYARQMDTPEVELAEDSWLKVMVAAYKVMKRAMELRQ